MTDPMYATFMGHGPKQLAHWEHWSNPDAATLVTGIDYYEKPRSCMRRLVELYPFLRFNYGVGEPADDTPIPRPAPGVDTKDGMGRWGDSYNVVTEESFSRRFPSEDAILRFSPLDEVARGGTPLIPEDYRSEEVIYQRYRKNYPSVWGDQAPAGSPEFAAFYCTMFMWPIVMFGYQNFLSLCLDPEFDRIMEEFAEINRRVFRAFARLPVNFVVCHDDIVVANGPMCNPAWMRKHIFPRYEEYWSHLRNAGKEVILMTDGCADAFVDDIMALGVRGIISEPYTDYKAIARRYQDCFLAGEGDVCVLMRNDPAEIRAMVESMVQTGRMSGGYMMCIGNGIPYNVPPAAVELYLDLSMELGFRM